MRALNVSWAEMKKASEPGGNKTLWVGGVPEDAKKEELEALFAPHGEVRPGGRLGCRGARPAAAWRRG